MARFPSVQRSHISSKWARAYYVELLPVEWRAITEEGITIDYRTYNCVALNVYRHKTNPNGPKGKWEVHVDEYDWRHVWLRPIGEGPFIPVPWTCLTAAPVPFTDATWRLAQKIVATRGQDPTHEGQVAQALGELLTRASLRPSLESKVVAMAQASPSLMPAVVRQQLLPPPEPETDEPLALPDAEESHIEGMGVHDPFDIGGYR